MVKVAHTRGILHTSKEILTVFGHLALEAKPITYSYPRTMYYIIQFSSCFQNVENIGQLTKILITCSSRQETLMRTVSHTQ